MADRALARPPQIDARPWLQRLPGAARFSFRGGAATQGIASAVFGVAFSTVACRAVTAGARSALWLGPDEQLLIAPAADAPAIPAQFATALSAVPHSLVDISHRQVALELRGAQAVWLLNGACPLDLDPSAFPVGMCTRTVFGKAEIVLWRTATEGFRVEVWRSFTRYVTGLLDEIARELPA
jgi:sarcosine oxidase subunit gamma